MLCGASSFRRISSDERKCDKSIVKKTRQKFFQKTPPRTHGLFWSSATSQLNGGIPGSLCGIRLPRGKPNRSEKRFSGSAVMYRRSGDDKVIRGQLALEIHEPVTRECFSHHIFHLGRDSAQPRREVSILGRKNPTAKSVGARQPQRH